MYAVQHQLLHRPRRTGRGFSLIELLVVTAILSVVVSGIVAVFLGSMKAVRQGYRHMDAYEMTRGAFQVVERDLTGGFTSREHGDYYQFCGTPYGMTFVGVASNFQGIGVDQGDNLCRVSYVIRQIASDPVNNAHPYDVIDTRDGLKPGFVLIRYVEKGIDNLDAFKKIDWTGDIYRSNNIEFPDGDQEADNLVYELAQAQNEAVSRGLGVEEQERFVAAKKRELWLRMLRGNGPVLTPTGDVQALNSNLRLPSFFRDYPANASDGRPDPLDYVVATNIYFEDSVVAEAEALEASSGHLLFGIKAFEFGFPSNRPATAGGEGNPTIVKDVGQFVVAFTNFWNASPTVNLANTSSTSVYSFGGEGSPLLPRIPSAVHLRLVLRFAAPNVAAAEIQRKLDEVIDIPSAYTRVQTGLS